MAVSSVFFAAGKRLLKLLPENEKRAGSLELSLRSKPLRSFVYSGSVLPLKQAARPQAGLAAFIYVALLQNRLTVFSPQE
jgi:hypothetical protein